MGCGARAWGCSEASIGMTGYQSQHCRHQIWSNPAPVGCGAWAPGSSKVVIGAMGYPNTTDTQDNRTPLSWAAEDGYEGIVKLLLKRKDTSPNTADIWHNRSPLWYAAAGGYEGVVKLLLGREDIHPDTADIKYGQTPLRCAAGGGNSKVAIGTRGYQPQYCRYRVWPNTALVGCGGRA